MSDLKITEFRERAETGVDFPDLAVIERRGRARRNARVAATVGGLALVLGAGVGISRMATDTDGAMLDPAAPPSSAPSTSSAEDGTRTSYDHGEEVFVPGPAEVSYGEIDVRFDVPGEGWEWFGAGMALRRVADDPDGYGATVFFLPEASARLEPCRDDREQPLGTDPDQLVDNVAPLLDLAGSTVLQGPRVVTAFGGEAVHLRLRTEQGCEWGDLPPQLRGVVYGGPVDPGWPDQHVLDVWHVVLPGSEPRSLLVASWDLDGTTQHLEQRQAVLDSLRIDAG